MRCRFTDGCTRRSFFTEAATALTTATAAALSARFLMACAPLQGESAGADYLATTFAAFDTVVSLKACCDKETLSAAQDRCIYFENILSRTKQDSDIGRLNEAGGSPVKVASETADVISRALEYARASDGLFDITIGAVSSLWDFDAGVRPLDGDLAKALAHVGWETVMVEGTTVTLSDPEAKLDLGGIAKGYIADDLVELFLKAGCTSALINLGGNVYALGTKGDGSAWKVGIQDPNGQAAQIIATYAACDTSVVTSGLYERQFTQDGITYWHILDPRTGMPVQSDLASTSVVCASSTDADVYATWAFLLGYDSAYELLDTDARFEALFVDSEGNLTTTAGAAFEVT